MFPPLVSRGRCGREIARLRRLAAVVAAIFLRFWGFPPQKSLAASDFFAAGEAKNPAISAAEWLRARLRPPWSLRFCDAIFVPLSSRPGVWPEKLGQESCRTKVSRIFRIFVPNFAPNFAPNFPRVFRGLFVLRLVGDGDRKKDHQKSPLFFECKIPRQTRKKCSHNSSGEQAK